MHFSHLVWNDGVDDKVKRELGGTKKVKEGMKNRAIENVFIRKREPE